MVRLLSMNSLKMGSLINRHPYSICLNSPLSTSTLSAQNKFGRKFLGPYMEMKKNSIILEVIKLNYWSRKKKLNFLKIKDD